MIATILYEDRLAAVAKGFGPHELLISCLADDTGGARVELKRAFQAVPCKGDGSLKAKLARDRIRLLNQGPLCAVFDHDRVRACFALPDAACKTSVLEEIRRCFSDRFGIVLMVENVEDLLRACREAQGMPPFQGKPTPNERDAICCAAAWADVTVRKRIRERMPSFDRLVKVALAMWKSFSSR